MKLAELHWSTRPGDLVEILLPDAAPVGAPSRIDLLTGAGFEPLDATARAVRARRLLSLPDTVGPRMTVLVCGLNPSIYAAERGVGFARGTNRFWRAAVAAGLVTVERDACDALASHGVGMTDLCKRATVASAELAPEEYRAGVERVERLVRWLRPRVVAFVGLEGWRTAIDPATVSGLQTRTFGGRPAYVLPSTSGLNARTSFADLVAHFEAVLSSGNAGVARISR